MPLREYRRKRDFRKTPEPEPGASETRHDGHLYLIQKHDASRLHYDFRLEQDGVLLSWAVTRGPSLDPHDKRLAVRTEDHPLEYGSFEGTIPEGEYGGGTVMLWDTGTWEPREDPHAGLAKGHLAFTLFGRRLTGDWDLIRMRGPGKRENWLLIKKADAAAHRGTNADTEGDEARSVSTHRSMDEIASGQRPLWRSHHNDAPLDGDEPTGTARGTQARPHRSDAAHARSHGRSRVSLSALVRRYPEVQLATLVSEAPAGDEWIHETKFDGYRLLGFVANGDVQLRTRNGKDWTEKFPAVADAMRHIDASDAVVDMEAVLLDKKGKSSFQSLQQALGDPGKRSNIVAYAFDVLQVDGDDLTGLPQTERKARLQAIIPARNATTALRYSDHIVGDGARVLAHACRLGLEGIVSKRAGAPYVAGRQRNWLKVKCGLRQEFVVLGWSDARTGNRALGALYLGYYEKGELRYAGKVGTGFTMESASMLAHRLTRIGHKRPSIDRETAVDVPEQEWRTIHWARPVLVCEVAFSEWTRDARIRHPSFKGLREDKPATNVRRELPARR